jgi:hypothetical protein
MTHEQIEAFLSELSALSHKHDILINGADAHLEPMREVDRVDRCAYVVDEHDGSLWWFPLAGEVL